MDPTTWNAVMTNPRDDTALAKVGVESYDGLMGGWDDSDRTISENLIRVVAKLLCLSFSKASPELIAEVRDILEGRRGLVEPAVWEPALDALAHHFLIEDALSKGRNTTLVELFAIAHDIEAYIRPGLFRLLWAWEKSSDGAEKSYSAYHLNSRGEEGSVGYALGQLRERCTQPSPIVLDAEEIRVLESFLGSISAEESQRVGVDDLRNWVAHRSYTFTVDGVILGLHPAPGARVLLSRSTVTDWRQSNIGLVCIFLAFRAMFLALAAATMPGLVPNSALSPLGKGLSSND